MNTRPLSKLVLSSLLAATACSTPDDRSTEGITRAVDTPVELRIKWWGSPDRANRTNAVIAMFNAQNPDIHVTGQWYPATQSGPIGTAYWPTLNDDAAH